MLTHEEWNQIFVQAKQEGLSIPSNIALQQNKLYKNQKTPYPELTKLLKNSSLEQISLVNLHTELNDIQNKLHQPDLVRTLLLTLQYLAKQLPSEIHKKQQSIPRAIINKLALLHFHMTHSGTSHDKNLSASFLQAIEHLFEAAGVQLMVTDWEQMIQNYTQQTKTTFSPKKLTGNELFHKLNPFSKKEVYFFLKWHQRQTLSPWEMSQLIQQMNQWRAVQGPKNSHAGHFRTLLLLYAVQAKAEQLGLVENDSLQIKVTNAIRSFLWEEEWMSNEEKKVLAADLLQDGRTVPSFIKESWAPQTSIQAPSRTAFSSQKLNQMLDAIMFQQTRAHKRLQTIWKTTDLPPVQEMTALEQQQILSSYIRLALILQKDKEKSLPTEWVHFTKHPTKIAKPFQSIITLKTRDWASIPTSKDKRICLFTCYRRSLSNRRTNKPRIPILIRSTSGALSNDTSRNSKSERNRQSAQSTI